MKFGFIINKYRLGVTKLTLQLYKIFNFILTYKYKVKKPEGKNPFPRSRRRQEDNIKIDFQETGWGVDWIYLPQYRDTCQALMNIVINVRGA